MLDISRDALNTALERDPKLNQNASKHVPKTNKKLTPENDMKKHTPFQNRPTFHHVRSRDPPVAPQEWATCLVKERDARYHKKACKRQLQLKVTCQVSFGTSLYVYIYI